jgi:hypothetical protein
MMLRELSESQIPENIRRLTHLNLVKHLLVFHEHGPHKTDGIDSYIIYSFLAFSGDHQKKFIAPNHIITEFSALQKQRQMGEKGIFGFFQFTRF